MAAGRVGRAVRCGRGEGPHERDSAPKRDGRAGGWWPAPPFDGADAPTIRGAVWSRLVELYSVDADELRLAFEVADNDFLAQAVGPRRVDVQPGGTGASQRVPVNISIYDGDRVLTTRL